MKYAPLVLFLLISGCITPVDTNRVALEDLLGRTFEHKMISSGNNFPAVNVRAKHRTEILLGLGNGRTYDHMCEVMPDRDIYVFERHIAAHPMNIPDDDHLLMGDIMETLPEAATRFEGQVALVHTDLGTGIKEENEKLAAKYPRNPPRPAHWGGFRIRPVEIEFWSSGDFRLHDRFKWTRPKPDGAKWSVQRLNP